MKPQYRSLQTERTYGNALRHLRQSLNAPEEDLNFLKDTNAIVNHIEGLEKSVNTRKVYYIAIVSRLKTEPGFSDVWPVYKAKMDSYNATIQKHYESQEHTDRERALFVEWPKILEARERLRVAVSDLTSYQDYVLLCLYTYLPPMRLDYSPVRVVFGEVPADASGNSLSVLPSGLCFVMNEYKTAHKYGRQETHCPKDLEAILREWLELNPTGWLLCNSDDTPMTEATLGRRISTVMERWTGKAAGVNILRHSFVSWMRRDEPTFQQQQVISSAMGHSVGMNTLYRRL